MSNLDQSGDGQDPNSSVMSSVMKEFTSLRDKLKNEDEDASMMSPFAGIEKASVLQEASSAFNDPKIVKNHPQQCCLILTKLLFLLAQGETFNGTEASGVFFAVTKLMQSQDVNLRRLTYLFIKEVSQSTDNQDIIIVIAALTKDMHSQVELYQANSIRVLCKIIDADILGQIERYIKQAVVDRNPLTSSSALVSGNQMVQDPAKREIVRRWVNEVQEAVSSRSEMVQYHALSLLYNLKSHDKLAVNKLVTQLTRSHPKSPLAMCLLVRYASRLLRDDLSAASAKSAVEFLESCLRHKNDMVIYEAARAICYLPDVAAKDLQPAIGVLQMFLSSPKPTLRFAAVRTLNEVAMHHPLMVTRCNEDMETLITDSNRSIATLATTTLLKTGSESSVDRLMKQISSFMSDIADEFKIVVVKAIRTLCIKYPAKNRVLLNFLSNVLREEGGFEFKKVIVDTILELIEVIPETKESGLFHLCEFIEDCEFSQLSAQILHVLGQVGPTTKNPAKYIRFIYNRVILENAQVRAAAASSLGMFAAKIESLRPSIISLLQRCLRDEDDEVRDRATIALSLLKSESPVATLVMTETLPVNPATLLKSVEMYKLRPSPGPVTFASLPVVADVPEPHQATNKREQEVLPGVGGPSEPTVAESSGASAEELYKVPEFARLGALFKSARTQPLTEAEAEYVVRYVKHVFDNHVVLQFDMTNTLNDQLLMDVQVELEELETANWEMETSINIPDLPFDVKKSSFICLRLAEGAESRDAAFAGVLKFKVRDVDPSTGEGDEDDEGFDEEYPLDDIEITTADFMKKLAVNDFLNSWETIGRDGEVLERFQLSKYKTVEEAVLAVIDFFQMQPCGGTGAVASGAKDHTLLLAGVYIGNENVLVRTKLTASEDGSILLKIAVRSNDVEISTTVLECLNG